MTRLEAQREARGKALRIRGAALFAELDAQKFNQEMRAERFRNQFPVRAILNDDVKAMLMLDRECFGYPVYRALNRLFLLDYDGEYYAAY